MTSLQNGDYRIESILGKGGFGITYKGIWKTKVKGTLGGKIAVEVPVAIKELFPATGQMVCTRDADGTVKPQFDQKTFEEYKKRFKEEALTLENFQDVEGVVHALGTFEENNTVYLVMEYVEGDSLREMVEKRGALPEAEAVGLAATLLDALAAVHARNVLHRDISPNNILINTEGQPILIDFGIAREFEEDVTQMHTAFQTPGYTAPEQKAQNAKRGAYTDLYSLGCVLYYMLTGQRPQDANEVALDGFIGPRARNPKVTEATDRVVAKALSPRPVDRYSSAVQMKKVLVSAKLASPPTERVTAAVPVKLASPETQPVTAAVPANPAPPKEKKDRKSLPFWFWLILVGAVAGLSVFFAMRDPKNSENPVKEPVEIVPSDNSNHSGSNTGNNPSPEKAEPNNPSNPQQTPIVVPPVKVDPKTYTENAISAKMIYVDGGTFKMGSDESEDEKPIHSVTLSGFYMGETEVTQAQWWAVMGTNPSHFSGCDNCPVEQVSWDDIQGFLKKLNQLTGKAYRLPTEAEWEYAAGGGAHAGFPYTYAGSNTIGNVAWYRDNSSNKTHPVGKKTANGLLLYDMSGNVKEWCQDWYDVDYYKSSPSSNPEGSNNIQYRILRGGSWDDGNGDCRVSNRYCNYPSLGFHYPGFRLARDL